MCTCFFCAKGNNKTHSFASSVAPEEEVSLCASVVEYVAFVLFLYIPSFGALKGGVELRDCCISLVSYILRNQVLLCLTLVLEIY